MPSAKLDAQFTEALRQRIKPTNGTAEPFGEYLTEINRRLELGELLGHDNWEQPVGFLAQAIMEEHIDIPTWSFILSCSRELPPEALVELLDLAAAQFELWRRFKRLAGSLSANHCHISRTFPAWKNQADGANC